METNEFLFEWPVKRPPGQWLTPAIPLFAPSTEASRAADAYDRDFSVVDLYTGLAYGHILFGEGAAEGLYRTMSSLVLARREAKTVLEVGCGTGRLLYDCAPLMPKARFVGIDSSYNMCLRAGQILLSEDPVPLPGWARRGRPGVVFQGARRFENVSLAQADAEDLPFESMSFDVVVAAMSLCRLRDPMRGLAGMSAALKPGGTLLLATPLGFSRPGHWETLGDAGRLRELLSGLGFRVHEFFEGLRYREVIDASGNAHEWNVRVAAASLMV